MDPEIVRKEEQCDVAQLEEEIKRQIKTYMEKEISHHYKTAIKEANIRRSTFNVNEEDFKHLKNLKNLIFLYNKQEYFVKNQFVDNTFNQTRPTNSPYPENLLLVLKYLQSRYKIRYLFITLDVDDLIEYNNQIHKQDPQNIISADFYPVGIRLYNNGIREAITIDINLGENIETICQNSEFEYLEDGLNKTWPFLLEKAYAKMLGSYMQIIDWTPAYKIFRDFCGAPGIMFQTKEIVEVKDCKFFRKLIKLLAKWPDSLLICGQNNTSEKQVLLRFLELIDLHDQKDYEYIALATGDLSNPTLRKILQQTKDNFEQLGIQKEILIKKINKPTLKNEQLIFSKWNYFYQSYDLISINFYNEKYVNRYFNVLNLTPAQIFQQKIYLRIKGHYIISGFAQQQENKNHFPLFLLKLYERKSNQQVQSEFCRCELIASRAIPNEEAFYCFSDLEPQEYTISIQNCSTQAQTFNIKIYGPGDMQLKQ